MAKTVFETPKFHVFLCFTASEYNISVKVKPKIDNVQFTKTESA